MDSGTNQAFVMASVARFCSLWTAGMNAALQLESVGPGQATLSLEARLGSPGGGPPPLFPGALNNREYSSRTGSMTASRFG